MIKFKRLFDDAMVPSLGSGGAAGFDLHSHQAGALYTSDVLALGTGIAAAIPEGYVGIIKPRSGLAMKYGVNVLAGVIDSDYRGEIKVLLQTVYIPPRADTLVDDIGRVYYPIKKGDKIAQLVIMPILTFAAIVEELDDTDRGDGGFGSTGR